MIFIGIIVFAFLLWRAVLPLECRPALKAAAGAAAFLAAFKFKIVKMLGGHYFAPDLPTWVILFSAWVFVTVFIFMFLLIVTDTFFLGLACGEALYGAYRKRSSTKKRFCGSILFSTGSMPRSWRRRGSSPSSALPKG